MFKRPCVAGAYVLCGDSKDRNAMKIWTSVVSYILCEASRRKTDPVVGAASVVGRDRFDDHCVTLLGPVATGASLLETRRLLCMGCLVIYPRVVHMLYDCATCPTAVSCSIT
jgi:hypothetical protein